MNKVFKGNIFITQRDQEIFLFLYKNKVACLRQLAELFFKGVNKKSAYRVLRRLVLGGFIDRIARVESERPTIAYSLSEKSFKLFFCSSNDPSVRKQYKSNSVEHDITLIDIQNRVMESSALVSYLTENMLQSRSEHLDSLPISDFIDLQTDAVFELEHKGETYFLGLEYEASYKYISRYREKLLAYYSRPSIGTVIFICANEQIQKALMRIEKQHCSKFSTKVYYCTLSNLLNRNSKMTFYNIKNESFDIT